MSVADGVYFGLGFYLVTTVFRLFFMAVGLSVASWFKREFD